MPKQYISAGEIQFNRKNQYGMKYYFAKNAYVEDEQGFRYGKYSVVQSDDNGLLYLRIWDTDTNSWKYPTWSNFTNGFKKLEDIQHWLSGYDWQDATPWSIEPDSSYIDTHKQSFIDAVELLGFTQADDKYDNLLSDAYELHIDLPSTSPEHGLYDEEHSIDVRALYFQEGPVVQYWIDGRRLPSSTTPPDTPNISKMVRGIERMLKKYGHEIISCIAFTDSHARSSILAAINTRDLTENLVRVRSSNVWAIGMNIKHQGDNTGDVLVQFKGPSGGNDIYIYYDVPITVYRRFVNSPSKGHFLYQNLRHNYRYGKLTGDKKTKLPNGVN